MPTVILHAPVEGLQVGDEYDGPNAEYHVVEGNARYKDKRKKAPSPYDKPKLVEYDHGNDPEPSDAPASTQRAEQKPIAEETVTNSSVADRNIPEPEPIEPAKPTEKTTADKITDIPDPNVDPHA